MVAPEGGTMARPRNAKPAATQRSAPRGDRQPLALAHGSLLHDVRHAVTTLVHLLERTCARWGHGLTEGLGHDLIAAHQESRRLALLLEDLAHQRRPGELLELPLELAPTELEPLVARELAVIAPLAWKRSGVSVLSQLGDDLPPVLADPRRLTQVLRNLLQNAVRSTAPGGLVLVRARPHANSLSLEIQDTGEGLDASVRRQLDGPSAAAMPHGSHGHGLYLVRELTESMGGRVAVHSTPGEGTCFVLRLPRANPQERPKTRPGRWNLSPAERARTGGSVTAESLPGTPDGSR
jgi:signal transduction histidine kinase